MPIEIVYADDAGTITTSGDRYLWECTRCRRRRRTRSQKRATRRLAKHTRRHRAQ